MVVVIILEDTVIIRTYWLHMKSHVNSYVKHFAYTLSTKYNAVNINITQLIFRRTCEKLNEYWKPIYVSGIKK